MSLFAKELNLFYKMADYTISDSTGINYVKFDPREGEYYFGPGKLKACVFTKEKAENFNLEVLNNQGILEHIGQPKRRQVSLEELNALSE